VQCKRGGPLVVVAGRSAVTIEALDSEKNTFLAIKFEPFEIQMDNIRTIA
jgi:hypothetical protein